MSPPTFDIDFDISCAGCGKSLEASSVSGRNGFSCSVEVCESCAEGMMDDKVEERVGELRGEINRLADELVLENAELRGEVERLRKEMGEL